MRQSRSLLERALAIVISIVMLLSTIPLTAVTAFAADTTLLETDFGSKFAYVGTPLEFYFKTLATEEDENKTVIGSFTLVDEHGADMSDAVDKLEYYDPATESWYAFYGDFGPAETGFPLTDGATTQFRVNFKTAGEYYLKAEILNFSDRSTLISTTKKIRVVNTGCELTTDIGTKTFNINQSVEFSYSTVPNDLAGEYVLGTFKVLDKDGHDAQSAVSELKYKEGENWYDFYGDFGPAGGFPLTAATSHFKATLNTVGTYQVIVGIKRVSSEEILCEKTTEIKVVDTEKPVISEVTGAPAAWTNSDATLTVSATDNSGAIAGYRVNDGEWQTSPSFTITANGEYKFEAQDASENISEIKTVVVSKIDKTAPSVTLQLEPDSISPAGDWTKDEITVTINAEDSGGSGLDKYYVDGAELTGTTFKVSDADEHTVKVTDNAGNETVVTFTAKYDATAPVIESVSGNPTDWTNADVVLTVNASDVGSGEITYTIDGNNWQTSPDFTITENGEYTIKARDVVGNESEAVTVNVNRIDKAVPTITSFEALATDWTNASVVVTGNLTDAESGAVKLYYQADGAAEWLEADFDHGNGAFNLTFNSEGQYTYKFYGEDAAGNQSAESVVTIKIDKTAPAVDAINASDSWKNESFTVTGEVSDDRSGITKVYYRLSGTEAWAEAELNGVSFNFTAAPTESGTYTYEVYCVDAAGNASDAATSPEYNFDNVKPVTVLNELDPAGWTNQATTVSGKVSDDLSEVVSVYYVKDEGEPVAITADAEGNISFTIPNSENNNSTYTVYCVDNAGNESEICTFTAQIDVTAPSVPTITYGTPAVQKVLESITFGLFEAEQIATIHADDDLSGVKEIKYTLGGVETTAAADEGTVYVTIPVGTNAKLTAVAYDNAGNSSEQEQTISKDSENYEFEQVVVDAEKPAITAAASTDDWTEEDVIISGTVSDENAGVEKVYIKKGEDGTYEEIADFDGTNFSYTAAAQDYEGDYILYCVDYFGHASDETTVSVKMDISDPKVDSISADPDSWTNGKVVISGEVSDTPASPVAVYYKQAAGEEKTAALADGKYSFELDPQDFSGNVYVWCEDAFGHKSDETSVFAVVNMDVTAPAVLSVTAEPSVWTNQDVVISGDVTDALSSIVDARSGVATVYYKQGTAGETKTATLSEDKYSFTISAETTYHGNIYVWCVDAAGNTSEEKSVEIKIDADAPVMEPAAAVPNDWTNQDVVISGKVFDDLSGVASVYCLDPNDETGETKVYAVLIFDEGTLNYKLTVPKTSYNGNIAVHAIDYAGNESTVDVGVKMDVDANVPVIVYSRNAFSTIVEVLTFGFYTAPVSAEINATDNYSLAAIEYSYTGTAGKFNSEPIEETKTESVSVDDADITEGTITVDLPANFRGTFKARAWDSAGNCSEWTDTASEGETTIQGLIIDSITPTRTVSYSEPVAVQDAATHASVDSYAEGDNVILYYKGSAEITLTIKEANFYPEDVVVTATRNDKDYAVTLSDWSNTKNEDGAENKDEFACTFKLEGGGDYFFTVTYTDRSGNEMAEYKSHEIHLADKDPEIDVIFDPDAVCLNGKYFSTDLTATIVIDDHNFASGGIVVTKLSALDVNGNSITEQEEIRAAFEEYLQNDANWGYLDAEGEFTSDASQAADPDLHVAMITFTTDAHYTLTLDYTNIPGSPAEQYKSDEFVIDHEAPANLEITYSNYLWQDVLSVITFNFYNPSVDVTVSATDATAGIDYFAVSVNATGLAEATNIELPEELVLNADGTVRSGKAGFVQEVTAKAEADGKVSLTFTVPAEFRGEIVIDNVVDLSGNGSNEYDDSTEIIVDTVTPTRTVSYSDAAAVVNAETLKNVESYAEGDNVILYYDGSAEITLSINEANFYPDDVVVTATKDGEKYAVTLGEWTDDGDEHVCKFTLEEDGDYFFTVTYTDRSGNEMVVYNSHEIRIDTAKPVIVVTYDPAEANANGKYFNTDRTATIEITDHNFRADDVLAEITAVDVTGSSIAEEKEIAAAFAAYLSDRANWYYRTADGELTDDVTLAADPDVHVAVITFTTDAQYTFTLDYADIPGNAAEQYKADDFVIDHEKPANLEITYSDNYLWQDVLSGITFNFYNPSVDVTVSATDATAGIDYFAVSVNATGLAEATNIELPEELVLNADGTVRSGKAGFVKEVTAKAEADGKISLTFTVPAEFRGEIVIDNVVDRSGNGSNEYDDSTEIIVDTVTPTRTVSYSDAAAVVNAETLIDVESYAEGDNVILYYDGNAEITLSINEANFYADDVVVTATKDGEAYAVTLGEWTDDGDVHVCKFTLEEDGDYFFTVTYTDHSGNEMVVYNSHEIRIDRAAPVIVVTYDPAEANANGKYFNTDRTATIEITDHNFRADDVLAVITAVDVTGSSIAEKAEIAAAFAAYLSDRANWYYRTADGELTDDVTKAADPDVHVAVITFTVDAQYTFTLDYTDITGLAAEQYQADDFVIDHNEPTNVTIEYSEPVGSLWKDVLSALTFGAYNPDKDRPLTVTLTAEDITSGVDYFEWTYTKQEGASDVNAASTEIAKIYPTETEYSTDGKTATVSFTVDPQARGYISYKAVDRAGNDKDKALTADDSRINIVDTINPDMTIVFEGSLKDKIDVDKDGEDPTRQTKTEADAETRYVYDGPITATITVKEANFYDDMVIVVERDGAAVEDSEISDWVKTENADEFVKTILLSKDGDYRITLEYQDRSANAMDYDANGEYAGKTENGVGTYVSNIHTIDTTAPTYTFTIYEAADVVQTIGERDYLAAPKTGVIKVTDRNFRPNEVEFTVVALDVNGEPVAAYTYSELTSWTDWTAVEGEDDTWIAYVPFDEDANYTVDFTYTDIAGHKVDEDFHKEFTVDTKAPENLNIEYDENNLVDSILAALTFNFYNPSVDVTVSATDATAGIDYFAVSVNATGLAEATDIELPEELVLNADGTVRSGKAGFVKEVTAKAEADGKVSLTFTVPAQFRGEIVIDNVVDRSGNGSSYDDNTEIIVDTVNPDMTIVFEGSLKDKIDVDKNGEDPTRQTKTEADAETRYVYDGPITATITVKEANFYDDMVITVTRDGVKVKDSEISDWVQNGDTFEFVKTIVLSKDGDYQITLEYQDRSANAMNYDARVEYKEKVAEGVGTYVSNIHTIDTTDPVYTLDVTYEAEDVVRSINGRDYLQMQQTDEKKLETVIKVTDRNFRPNEVGFTVSALDVNGAPVAYTYSELTSWKDWTAVEGEDDTWQAIVPFAEDANYTVDFTYTDIAGHKVAEDDHREFTEDRTAPDCVRVEYSETVSGNATSEKPVLQQLLENISFGALEPLYYQKQMTVTIVAEDTISGVAAFDFMYTLNKGVSGVNNGLNEYRTINEVTSGESESPVTRNGYEFSASFNIPLEDLTETNQFNGTVCYSATDRSANTSDKVYTQNTVIVDSIAPTCQVTFNNPVETAGDVSYYDGDIVATIVITEANFDGPQVYVNVNEARQDVHWSSNGDIHTGVVTIHEDGDYKVSVTYTDRSGNTMAPYTSNQLTIDAGLPVIDVSGITHQSANNGETIGITVTVTDSNLKDFTPVLTAVVKVENDDGTYSFETVEYPLELTGESSNGDGETVYTYTIKNLETDGYYTLTCTAADYSGHTVTAINVDMPDGSRAEVEAVEYTVNRNGSVFWIETKQTDKYAEEPNEWIENQLFDAYANDQVVVTVYESNVDKIDTDADKKTTFVLNDGSSSEDIALEEGSNYTKNARDEKDSAGKWYLDVYTLDNDTFDHDGVYSVNLITYDTAKNSNVNSKFEAGVISFTLDRTNPVVSVNVQDDQSINNSEYWVEFNIADANLNEESVKVNLYNNNGNKIDVDPVSLGYNEYKFLLDTGYKYTIEIEAEDLAGNPCELCQVENVTVSTNIFVLWYANTPLFWGSVGGAAAVAGAAVLLIILKKKRRAK